MNLKIPFLEVNVDVQLMAIKALESKEKSKIKGCEMVIR
jgi:hypothetical protein